MVECPVCHTTNPPGSHSCSSCSTPIEIIGATIVMTPEEQATILDSSPSTPGSEDTVDSEAGATGWSVPIQKLGAANPRAEIQPGTVLGERYEILKHLGEGGMGAVYKARDRELDRLLALKVIRPELAGNPDILRRFKQELILARQVTHKNVIRIFDLGMADGLKFITMDYIEGRDLKSIIVERGRIPAKEAVPIIQQVCRGLEAAHVEGVVHRDLKPQNIMVDANGRVWVMDFGLARSMEMAGLTRTGALMGTPDYMSPEQARAEKVDARSDLFSLGIIFYEMLTGRLAFEADTMMATLLKRVQEKAIPPNVLDPTIPLNLNNVVMKCLEADTARRYQTAGELLAELAGEAQMSPAPVQTPAFSLAAMGPGAQFGPRYKIESVIGEGGMGKVYKAQDSDLDRTVALKLVRQELANDPSSMQRFKQELLLASRISHRNILRIHDLGDVGGVKFISMAYVEGTDLHDVLTKGGRLPVERVVNIAKQLASALDAAHSEGVVHRDLKPRNVLIDHTDHVYVSDFGLAKSLEGEAATMMTRAGEVLGTPRYMSPEQAESKPADHRSDIYSFGVILYEMATGDAPFGGNSTLQVMYQHVTQKPKDPKLANPALPDYLAQIILKCLEKDPALRYQQAQEILRDLEAGTPPTRVVRLRIAETGYPRWLLGSMAGLLLLIGAMFAIPSSRNAVLGRLHGTRGDHASNTALQRDKYVAVLPFKVLADEPALKYVADGIVDSLSAQLFQLKNVYVAPSSAVEEAAKKGSVDKVAKALGVNLIIEGTVRGAGDKIGISISVQDVKKGQRVWSKEFPPGLRRDLLTIENSVYSELVSALDLKPNDEELTRGAMRMTGNYSAYELYLKGRDVMHRRRDIKGFTSALDYYDQAVRKDPRFALAYAGMAEASMLLYEETKVVSWSQKALSAAQQAQQLNPDLPEVHWALGSVYLKTGKTEEAIAETKQALELAPSSDESYRRLGHVYGDAGRKKEAIAAYQKAVDINPYYWFNHNWLGVTYANFGENGKALDAFRRVTELAPDLASGYNNMGGAYFQLGKWTEAVAAYRKSFELEKTADAESNLGVAYYYLGLYSEAAKAMEKAVQMDPNRYDFAADLGDAYRQMGQRDKAVAAYDTAINLALKAYQVNQRDASTLGGLALYYAKKGDLRRAEDFIMRARAIDASDNVLMYNAALIQAIAGKPAEALKGLREALQKGYPPEVAKSEPELAGLRSSAEFEKLIQEFSRKSN